MLARRAVEMAVANFMVEVLRVNLKDQGVQDLIWLDLNWG